jgi:hypothetical protein
MRHEIHRPEALAFGCPQLPLTSRAHSSGRFILSSLLARAEFQPL